MVSPRRRRRRGAAAITGRSAAAPSRPYIICKLTLKKKK